jgi:photosystem II Psb27 protein
MKRYLSRVLALVCVCVIGLTGVAGFAAADSLSGQYQEDTLAVIQVLKTALDVTPDNPDRPVIQTEARQKINEYASRYRRDGSVSRLNSFTTMRTALNSMAAHYSAYPNRPIPEKLKTRVRDEFKQVELALGRGL